MPKMPGALRPWACALLSSLCLAATSPALASCQLVGDSIAAGIAPYLRGCASSTQVGISSGVVLGYTRPGYAVTVVSAGSNDGGSAAAMDAIRARAGGELIAILPSDHPRTIRARAIVAAWAVARGVRTVSFVRGAGSFHPASYPALARAVLAAMGR